MTPKRHDISGLMYNCLLSIFPFECTYKETCLELVNYYMSKKIKYLSSIHYTEGLVFGI